jgi:hypothetical protein
MHECSRCRNDHYCSKECQKEHWPEHKTSCRRNTESAELQKKKGGKRLSDMFSSWRTEQLVTIKALPRSVLSNKQFKMQPPNFVVSLEVDFNYNYETFLPLAPPSVTMFEDFPSEFRAILKETLETAIRQKDRSPDVQNREQFSHIIVVSCRATGIPAMMPVNSHPFCKKHSIDSVYWAIKKDVKVSSAYYNVGQYRSLQLSNLNQQSNAVRESEVFSLFTQQVFRMHSKEPRHKTHAIVLFFDFDFGLGQMKTFTEYEVKPLDEMKALVQQGSQSEEEKQSLISNCLDVENSPVLLQSRIKYPRNALLPMFVMDSDRLILLPACSFAEVMDHGTMLVKTSDREAEVQFRTLQKVSFPPVLNSPSLVD